MAFSRSPGPGHLSASHPSRGGEALAPAGLGYLGAGGMERTGGGKDDGSAPPRSDWRSKRKQRKQGAQQKQNQPKIAGRGAVNE